MQLAEAIDAIGCSVGPIACSETDDGEVIAEWIRPGRRLGFSFEPTGRAYWYYVDLREGRRSQQSGELTEQLKLQPLVDALVA